MVFLVKPLLPVLTALLWVADEDDNDLGGNKEEKETEGTVDADTEADAAADEEETVAVTPVTATPPILPPVPTFPLFELAALAALFLAFPLPLLRFLITSVFIVMGLTTPLSFQNRPHALHSSSPLPLRRHNEVLVVPQFVHKFTLGEEEVEGDDDEEDDDDECDVDNTEVDAALM